MIFPIPTKVKLTEVMDFYPWTVTIAFLNLLFFWMLFANPQQVKKTEFSSQFITSAGRYYLEWLGEKQFGRQEVELQAYGAQGVRNVNFINSFETWNSNVDPVGFQSWKKEIQKVFKEEEAKPISVFGLSQIKASPWTWITYQFSHQDAMHLLSNMILMVVFSAIVESMVGGPLMGLVYILSGLMGGLFFMHMDQSGFIPMVGASASVTGLMGFVAMGSLRKNIPYFYFFAPFKGFFGVVYLSPFWVISLFLIEDVTQMLSEPPGWVEGVAYSAHLGGACAGLLLGLAFHYGVKRSLVKNG